MSEKAVASKTNKQRESEKNFSVYFFNSNDDNKNNKNFILFLMLSKCNSLKLRILLAQWGDRGSTVVKVPCYESEGRWFDPSWCQWIFH